MLCSDPSIYRGFASVCLFSPEPYITDPFLCDLTKMYRKGYQSLPVRSDPSIFYLSESPKNDKRGKVVRKILFGMHFAFGEPER